MARLPNTHGSHMGVAKVWVIVEVGAAQELSQTQDREATETLMRKAMRAGVGE